MILAESRSTDGGTPVALPPKVAGTTAIGGVRPSTEHGGKRAGGRYVLGDLLGRGGMAEVFAGHAIGDHGFQKPVAIKRLLPELASDHVFVERLIGEAKLLVGMQHGNIVSVLDLARDGDDVFLVMEYVDGPSLRQLLKARGARGLSLGTATYIVQTAATGLEFAHSRPGGAIIHADISPSNLLLTTSGEVRVADFGIARREGGGHGVVEGKWAYMAPEQARGEPLTPRSDVFALGVVLYELITGAHPFGRQVTHEERDSEPMRVIPPRVVKPSIPLGVDAICMRALAHDPRDRYARMQQLIDALVEERFTNQYREGAADLAQAIRECSVQSAVVVQPRTQVTDRPVTIMTRSLIEQTPARRASSPSLSRAASASESAPSYSRSARGSTPPIQDSGAQTANLLSDELIRAAALLEIPPMLRADGTPMPPFRLGHQAMQGPELASVVGGHTITGGLPGVASIPAERSNTRWTIAILGIAAVIGAIAAVVMQLTPDAAPPPAEPPAAIQQAAQPPPAQEAPKAETVETPTIATAPPVTEPAPTEPAPTEVKPTEPQVETKPDEAKDEPADPVRHAVKRPIKRVEAAKSTAVPGILRIGTEEFAWVYVAGQKRESFEKIALPPGKYTVRVKNARTGEDQTRSVLIESDKTRQITVEWEEE